MDEVIGATGRPTTVVWRQPCLCGGERWVDTNVSGHYWPSQGKDSHKQTTDNWAAARSSFHQYEGEERRQEGLRPPVIGWVQLVVSNVCCADDEDNCKEEFGGHLTLPIWGCSRAGWNGSPAQPNLGTPGCNTWNSSPLTWKPISSRVPAHLRSSVGHPSIQCETEQTNKSTVAAWDSANCHPKKQHWKQRGCNPEQKF